MAIKVKLLWPLLSGLLVLTLLASACATAPAASPTAAPAAKPAAPAAAPAKDKTPVLIGISHDVTGYNADAGRAERDAAILAIEEWNAKGGVNGGREIKYVFRDNAGDPAKATAIAKELVGQKITAFFGGTSSTVGIPETKVLTPERIPYVGGAASIPMFEKASDDKWYYFSACTANPQLADAALADMVKQGYKRIAFFYSNVAWPQDMVKVQKQLIAEKYGSQIQVVGEMAVDNNATDLTAEVMKLRDLKADAVNAILFAANAKAYYRAAADIGWRPVAPSYNYWALMESVYLTSDKTLLWGTRAYSNYSDEKPAFADKKKQFMTKFGYEPVGHFAFAYDGVSLLLKAIDAAGTDGPAIRDYLATKSKGQQIVSGKPSALADFTQESYHSLIRGEDFAMVNINEKGEKVWQK